jgi:multiple sugar transport system substrate-binding protein
VSRKSICCLPLLLVLTGCPDEKKTERVESLPYIGQDIRIGVPAEMGFRTAWEGPLNEWSAQTGGKYTLTELMPGDHPEGPALFEGDDRQTLAVFPLEQAPAFVAAGQLAPIPESLRKADENGVLWPDLFAGLAAKIASRRGTPMFVPLECPVLVCYYRHDLLNAAGLNPPQTWDEYQQLLERIPAWAPGLVAVEPWSEQFRTTMFLARAVSLAQHPGHFSLFFDIETGEPLIDSPGFIRALEVACAAVARMDPAALACNPADCRAAVLSGRAALSIAYESPGFDRSSDTEHQRAPAQARAGGMTIGVARLPGTKEIYNPSRHVWEAPAEKGIQRVTLCGFGGWAIAASAAASPREIEASWNALARVRGRDGVSGFPAEVVGLCRESQLSNPAGALGVGLDGEEAAAYANAVAQSLRDPRVVAELPVTGRDEFRGVLTKAIGEALAGSREPDKALETASRGWRDIINRIGTATVRDSYRVNLGLAPMSAPGR